MKNRSEVIEARRVARNTSTARLHDALVIGRERIAEWASKAQWSFWCMWVSETAVIRAELCKRGVRRA
jgi:hypothetical protein